MSDMTPLYDATESATRIKALQRMRRQNALRLRRLRGVPLAGLPYENRLHIHRSAFMVMSRVWYQFLQTDSGRAGPTEDELHAAKERMQATMIMGQASVWYINNLKKTPYAAIAPYCLKVTQDYLAIEDRFEQRLANGQQWLTQDERTCYDHVRPRHLRRGKNKGHLLGPGIMEAVWNTHDYMARQLGEHYAATGRRVTEAEFKLIADGIRPSLVNDAYQDAAANVDRTNFDLLGTRPFAYAFDTAGNLTGVERLPVDAADVTLTNQDPEVQRITLQMKDEGVSTGCPVIHAKTKTPKGVPNNFVEALLDTTLAAMHKAVFAPDDSELRLFWPSRHDDKTAVPNGKRDNRPAPPQATSTDKLES